MGAGAISDDGQFVAVTYMVADIGEELWLVEADSGAARQLVSAARIAALRPDPVALAIEPSGIVRIPGTHTLVFYTFPVYDGLVIFEPSDLWLLDVDQRASEPELFSGGAGWYRFSPDGERVALWNSAGISLAMADGTGIQRDILPAYRSVGMGKSHFTPLPFWSPDSGALFVVVPDSDDIFTPEAMMRL